MRMPNKLLMISCLLIVATQVAPAAKATDSLESVLTMQVDGSIVIDPTGQVSGFTIDTQLPETIRVPLDRTVRTWHFEPVIVDGAPHAANAKMRVILSALAQGGDKYQIKIDNVVFPSQSGTDNATAPLITGKSLPPPSYPPRLLYLGISGTVLLAVKVDADGQVAQAMVVQSALLDVEGDKSTLNKAVRMFEQSAIGATKKWRFNVASKDGPLSVRDMTVIVPVAYYVSGAKPVAPGTWRMEARVPPRPIEWLQDESDVQVIGVDDVVYGEVLPVGRKLTLVTNVAGTVL